MDPVMGIISVFWLMLPAYLANPFAVFTGHGLPVDMGRSIGGKRVLGDGKTWAGLIGGICGGVLIGLLMMAIMDLTGEPLPIYCSEPHGIMLLFLISTGSLMGDLLGSFLKRRLGRERGARTPILDQYDFVIGAWAFLAIFQWGWFRENFVDDPRYLGMIAVLIITPLLHRLSNIIGFRMGQKEVPW